MVKKETVKKAGLVVGISAIWVGGFVIAHYTGRLIGTVCCKATEKLLSL